MGSDQIKPELSREAKTTQLRLLDFGHIMKREDPLDTTMIPGKGSWKRGAPFEMGMRWVDSIQQAC